jgi:hypothetical protein
MHLVEIEISLELVTPTSIAKCAMTKMIAATTRWRIMTARERNVIGTLSSRQSGTVSRAKRHCGKN